MSKTHMVVLGILNERPMYAYEFKEIIVERGFEHWAGIQLRSIYKAMESLVAKGLITGTEKVHPNKSVVTVYEVNNAGRLYLKNLVEKAFYKDIGTSDTWLAVAFIFSTTRSFAIKALEDNLNRIRAEKERSEEWIRIYESGEEFIPINYQSLIQISLKSSIMAEEEFNNLKNVFENGEHQGFFFDEREGFICKENS